jgi:hypothetical protein
MLTSLEELKKMPRGPGMVESDVEALANNGLTVTTARKAAEYGISLKDIYEWYAMHGASSITLLARVMNKLRPPAQQPKPKPEE